MSDSIYIFFFSPSCALCGPLTVHAFQTRQWENPKRSNANYALRLQVLIFSALPGRLAAPKPRPARRTGYQQGASPSPCSLLFAATLAMEPVIQLRPTPAHHTGIQPCLIHWAARAAMPPLPSAPAENLTSPYISFNETKQVTRLC